MVAYTGIETISNMAEEARDYGKTIPRSIGGVVVAVAAIYAFLPAVALSAMPVVNGETAAGAPEDQAATPGDPVLGVVKNIDLGSLQHAGGDLRRHPGRHDPVHRHERRPDRRVAAHLLDGPAPPAAGEAAPAAPEVPHALHRDPRVRR